MVAGPHSLPIPEPSRPQGASGSVGCASTAQLFGARSIRDGKNRLDVPDDLGKAEIVPPSRPRPAALTPPCHNI